MDEKLEELIERGMKMLDEADRQEAEKRRLEEEERQKRIEDEWSAIIRLLPDVLVPYLVIDANNPPIGGVFGNRLNFNIEGIGGFQAVLNTLGPRDPKMLKLEGYMVTDGKHGLPYRPEKLAQALAHARRLFLRDVTGASQKPGEVAQTETEAQDEEAGAEDPVLVMDKVREYACGGPLSGVSYEIYVLALAVESLDRRLQALMDDDGD